MEDARQNYPQQVFAVPIEQLGIQLHYSYKRWNGPTSHFIDLPPQSSEITLKNLSDLIIQQQGLSLEWICAMYSQSGYPLTGRLSQLPYIQCTQVLPARAQIHLFTVPMFDKQTLPALDTIVGPNTLILKSTADATFEHEIKVDFQSTTVMELKQKVFAITNLPTFRITLKKQDSFISQNDKVLSYYQLQENQSIMFEQAEVLPKNLTFKKKLKQSVEQTKLGQHIFHSLMFCLSQNLSISEIPTKQAFLAGIRKVSGNCSPLIQTLSELSAGQSMSHLNAIALQQGFILVNKFVLREILTKEVQDVNLLQYTLQVCALISDIFNRPLVQDSRQQTYTQYRTIDPLSLDTVIKDPVYLRRTDGDFEYYDLNSLTEKLRTEQDIPNLRRIDLQTLNIDTNFQYVIKRCQYNLKTSVLIWTGTYDASPSFSQLIRQFYPQGVTFTKAESLQSSYKIVRILPPLMLKHPLNKSYLTRNSSKQIRVIHGLNSKVPNKVDLRNISTGEIDSIDIDDLASVLEARPGGHLSEDIKQQLTRDPLQAIVVAFDKSGSMSNRLPEDMQYSRIDATKQFFQNFCDRTMGYNYQHVMSLLLFDSQITKLCNFTENMSTFAQRVHLADASGGTRLWDCLDEACNMLIAFKCQFPECKLRILGLSDGQDTSSNKSNHFQVLQKMISNGITLDCVVVGQLSHQLKAISLATTGYVFLPSTIQQGIKLFQSETFLSWRNRDNPPPKQINTQEQLHPFIDMPFSNGEIGMKAPQGVKAKTASAATVLANASKASSSGGTTGASLRRVLKELQDLTNDPHSSVSLFPVADDPSFWNLYMKGPDDTPYSQGLFHLYVNFKQDYPFKPPEVRFVTPIYHCNINSTGRICHSILDQFWSPVVTIRHVIDCIFGLLMTPEPQDPLDAHIAAEYLHSYEEYQVNAKAHTLANAGKSLEELTGVSAVDPAQPNPAVQPAQLPPPVQPDVQPPPVQPPQYFLDPISGNLMNDPVICLKSNKCYERAEIEKVIAETGLEPGTGQAIALSDLVPNIPLQNAIQEFKQANP